jgi:large subunit ribosomal protein L27
MAHTKSGSTSKNLRESASKRLGVKKNHGQMVTAGEIIVRQRGTKYLPGLNVRRAGDDTLYAVKNGKVLFKQTKKTRFDGAKRYVTKISVIA